MAILPLKDDNDLKRISFQYVTVGLIAACVAVFLWQLSLGEAQGRAALQFGAIPSVLFGGFNLCGHRLSTLCHFPFDRREQCDGHIYVLSGQRHREVPPRS